MTNNDNIRVITPLGCIMWKKIPKWKLLYGSNKAFNEVSKFSISISKLRKLCQELKNMSENDPYYHLKTYWYEITINDLYSYFKRRKRFWSKYLKINPDFDFNMLKDILFSPYEDNEDNSLYKFLAK